MNLEQLAKSSICGREPRAEAPPQAKEEEEEEVDDDEKSIAGALPPPPPPLLLLIHVAAPTASSAAAAEAATSLRRLPRWRRRGVAGSWISSLLAAGAGIFSEFARVLRSNFEVKSEREQRLVKLFS